MASFYNYECEKFTWDKVNGLYQINNEFKITMDDKETKYTITIKPGFRTDGGSVPWPASLYFKSWTKDYKYNGCFVLHDALYSTNYVKREIADDMLRCALRDCGKSRRYAGIICGAVKKFAEKHYGPENDKTNERDFVKFFSDKL